MGDRVSEKGGDGPGSRRNSAHSELAVDSCLAFSFYHPCSRKVYLWSGKLWEKSALCSVLLLISELQI